MHITKISSVDLTEKVVSEVGEFMSEGFKTEKLPRVFDPIRFTGMWKFLLESTDAAMFLLLDKNNRAEGIIGGIIQPDLCTKNILGAELEWRVSKQGKGWGMALLKEFEMWATSMGATKLIINSNVDHLDAARVARKAKKNGYAFSGFQMMKGV